MNKIAIKKYNELRLRKAKLDDIVLSDGDLNLENMDGKCWWLGFYKGNKRISFWISSKSKIKVTVQQDDLKIKRIEQEK